VTTPSTSLSTAPPTSFESKATTRSGGVHNNALEHHDLAIAKTNGEHHDLAIAKTNGDKNKIRA
jgi:hypothetical protein